MKLTVVFQAGRPYQGSRLQVQGKTVDNSTTKTRQNTTSFIKRQHIKHVCDDRCFSVHVRPCRHHRFILHQRLALEVELGQSVDGPSNRTMSRVIAQWRQLEKYCDNVSNASWKKNTVLLLNRMAVHSGGLEHLIRSHDHLYDALRSVKNNTIKKA